MRLMAVMKCHAPPPRPTRAAAVLLATLLSLPFALLTVLQLLL